MEENPDRIHGVSTQLFTSFLNTIRLRQEKKGKNKVVVNNQNNYCRMSPVETYSAVLHDNQKVTCFVNPVQLVLSSNVNDHWLTASISQSEIKLVELGPEADSPDHIYKVFLTITKFNPVAPGFEELETEGQPRTATVILKCRSLGDARDVKQNIDSIMGNIHNSSEDSLSDGSPVPTSPIESASGAVD